MDTTIKEHIIFQNEQEIMKYVSSFDMKLSVVLFKIQLNSLINKQHYNTTTDFFNECKLIYVLLNVKSMLKIYVLFTMLLLQLLK